MLSPIVGAGGELGLLLDQPMRKPSRAISPSSSAILPAIAQQGRFAGPVAADQADALIRLHGECRPVEQRSSPNARWASRSDEGHVAIV